jgi:predicted RNA binding protein with dsRBD fold (UPF0201 family)
MKISVSVPVYPTETQEKIEKALENLFPDLHVTESDKGLSACSEDKTALNTLRKLLEQQRIRDTARDILVRHTEDNTLTFFLNKQAAYMGKINFSEECPLDPIKISITARDISSVIQYLCGK